MAIRVSSSQSHISQTDHPLGRCVNRQNAFVLKHVEQAFGGFAELNFLERAFCGTNSMMSFMRTIGPVSAGWVELARDAGVVFNVGSIDGLAGQFDHLLILCRMRRVAQASDRV
jgi:hypothetical protein